MIAALCFLLLPLHSSADWQNPVGVCVDSRGCGSGSESVRGSNSSSGGGSMPWGHMTSRGLEKIKRCGDPLCWMIQGPIALTIGAVCDAPYYLVKGVGYGLYYGGRGLGKGLASIGRGIAYPFNRPPKPKLPPTTWEQYKHDVLKHQKALAKADRANKETQRWCVKNVPLEISPNRARWESFCNAGDAVSRAALPPDVVALGLAPVSLAASPATVIVDGSAPFANPSSEAGQAPAAPPVGAPVPFPAEAALGDTAPAEPNPAVSQQQAVQIGVAAGFSDGSVAIAGTAPAPIIRGKPLRTLPSATPANSLTPSEYGFEGRGGYGVRYDQIWGKETPVEEFIAKWNVMGPLKSMQTTIRTTTFRKATSYVKENYLDKAADAILHIAKNVRGSTGIVERVENIKEGGSVVAKHNRALLEDTLENINKAASEEGFDPLGAELDKEQRRNDALRNDAERLWMGQVRDPLQLKEETLEQTKNKLWPVAPRQLAIREKTVCHIADPIGIGCSTSKIIYSTPR